MQPTDKLRFTVNYWLIILIIQHRFMYSEHIAGFVTDFVVAELASYSIHALTSSPEVFAFPRAIALTRHPVHLVWVDGQLMVPMSKLTLIIIVTVAFFRKVFAHFCLVFEWLCLGILPNFTEAIQI
jgi:hypothetical protein